MQINAKLMQTHKMTTKDTKEALLNAKQQQRDPNSRNEVQNYGKKKGGTKQLQKRRKC